MEKMKKMFWFQLVCDPNKEKEIEGKKFFNLLVPDMSIENNNVFKYA